jgi:AcrR family transcriptional regulator
MPKQTFLNLPEEKQSSIIHVAIDEFAEHGFEGASITQMVSRAGIAKGSFYQYFEDKHDLFMVLVELLSQEKRSYFQNRQPPNPDLDFFGYLRWVMEAGFEFTTVQPRLAQAVSRVLFGEAMAQGALFEEVRASSARMLNELMCRAIARGDIDASIDPRVATFIFETLLNNVGLFILSEQDVRPELLAQGNIDWLKSNRSREIMDDVLSVLEYGFRKRNTGEERLNDLQPE